MDPDPLIPHLISQSVLTDQDAENISHAGPPHAKVKALLDWIKKKPDSAYYKLLNALWKTGQGHVATKLEEPAT